MKRLETVLALEGGSGNSKKKFGILLDTKADSLAARNEKRK